MNPAAKKRVALILSGIVFCMLVYLYIDFSRFFRPDGIDYSVSFWSLFFKGGVVLFTTLLIFGIGPDGISMWDTRRLKLSGVLIIVADIMLLMGKTAIGIVVFAAVQCALMLRNSRYFRAGYKKAPKKRRALLIFAGLLLLSWTVLLQYFVFYPLLEGKALQWVIIGYALFISASTWVALANRLLYLFPRPNSTMLAAGMVSFLLCDLNVGLLLSLPAGVPRLLAESFIWVFYAPALTLLALSGYRYHTDDASVYEDNGRG